MKTKEEQIEELKTTAAKLQRQIEALEKPKQWEPKYNELTLSELKAVRTHRRLVKYVKEFGGDWEADWEDKQQKKYYVYYSYHTLGWCMHHAYNTIIGGTVYMSQECALRLAKKLNSGEVVL
tara:strand:+ start:615 stop:980 length:366 start_codon:yes stop_codon:yes gene_type:complete